MLDRPCSPPAPIAIATTATDLALLVLVACAGFADELVNPDFLGAVSDAVGRKTALPSNPFFITIVAAVLLLWDAVEALRRARHAANVPPAGRSVAVDGTSAAAAVVTGQLASD